MKTLPLQSTLPPAAPELVLVEHVAVQILYAIPFVAASFIAFIVFLIVPRLRRFALSALVAPVVFGVCSIVGLLLFALAIDAFHMRYESLPRFVAIGAGLLAYFGSGVAGALVSIAVCQYLIRFVAEED